MVIDNINSGKNIRTLTISRYLKRGLYLLRVTGSKGATVKAGGAINRQQYFIVNSQYGKNVVMLCSPLVLLAGFSSVTAQQLLHNGAHLTTTGNFTWQCTGCGTTRLLDDAAAFGWIWLLMFNRRRCFARRCVDGIEKIYIAADTERQTGFSWTGWCIL